MRKLFASQGYRVEVAADGAQALERLGQDHYAVVVTDLEMPVMDGLERITAMQGRLETDDIPIIAIILGPSATTS